MSQSQQEGTGVPETNVSNRQQGGPSDAARGRDVADYNTDVDYEPEGSGPDIKAVFENEEDSDAEYAKMELP